MKKSKEEIRASRKILFGDGETNPGRFSEIIVGVFSNREKKFFLKKIY
jgi:hypothetical protein